MKLLIDENIPYAKEIFGVFGEVILVPGRLISKNLLKGIDILIIRSATKVNEELLYKSCVKFVGTTTSGFDHVDKKWLKNSGIFFSYAPSCNKVSVVEYVISVLLLEAKNNNFDLNKKVVGIVGVGNIGSYLNFCLKKLGIKTLLCDPLKKISSKNKKNFFSLSQLINKSDIISFHTSLSENKKHSSYHLLDKYELEKISHNCIILNTSRGSVINNKELLKSLKKGKKINVVLDVWENEPNISVSLLNKINIATPHIAGYSIEGKIRGAFQIFDSLNCFLNLKNHEKMKEELFNFNIIKQLKISGKLNQKKLTYLVHSIYNVYYDNTNFRRLENAGRKFDYFRKHYLNRREWSSCLIQCDNFKTANILKDLGFKTKLI